MVQKRDEWAECAFIDELRRAQDALTWRAVVVAHRTGRAIWDYAAAQGDEFVDPWIDWRGTLADQPGAQFVHSLSEDELLCLGLANHVNKALRLDQPPERVPTDGDIGLIAGVLETVDARTWTQWFESLGEPPKEIRCRHLLQLAPILFT